jgi:hypothetical protein
MTSLRRFRKLGKLPLGRSWASRTNMVLEALLSTGALPGMKTPEEYREKFDRLVEPEDGPEVRKLKAWMALSEPPHTCHALGCTTPCKPEYLMCPSHWRHVPKKLQRQVWATYRPGQCDDMKPSAEWHLAADAAICAVAIKEGKMTQEQARAKLKKSVEFARQFRGEQND